MLPSVGDWSSRGQCRMSSTNAGVESRLFCYSERILDLGTGIICLHLQYAPVPLLDWTMESLLCVTGTERILRNTVLYQVGPANDGLVTERRYGYIHLDSTGKR